MRQLVECSKRDKLLNVARWNTEQAQAAERRQDAKTAERLEEQSERLFYQALSIEI